MAKQDSFIKIRGTLDGLTFYKSKDGHLVRRKGGVSRERIMTEASFVRTRENIAEFGLTANSGRLLRSSIGVLLHKAKDHRMASRMLSVLSKVSKFDGVSARGHRIVSEGLLTPGGKSLLKGFDFNKNAKFQTVFHAPYTLDTVTGIVSIPDFVPLEQLSIPQGATHVSFRNAFVTLDFITETFDTQYSPNQNIALDLNSSSITLTPAAVPGGTGLKFYFLLIAFSQEVNGVQYPLSNDEFNVLNLLDVV